MHFRNLAISRGRNQTGVHVMHAQFFFQKDGILSSSNQAYVFPIRNKRPNLTVITNIRVTKVTINSVNTQVKGVEYAWEHNQRKSLC